MIDELFRTMPPAPAARGEIDWTVVALVGCVFAPAVGLLILQDQWNKGWRPFGRRGVRAAVGRGAGKLRVVSRTLPAFRFQDAARAAAHVAGRRGDAVLVDQSINRDLGDVLAGRNAAGRSVLAPAPRTARPVGPGDGGNDRNGGGGPKTELFADDGFHVFGAGPAAPPGSRAVLRVRPSHYGTSQTVIEAAAGTFAAAQELLDAVEARSVSHSIYRGALLEFRHQGSYDEDGDFAGGGEPELTFKPKTRLAAEDIVLDPATLPVLRRNLVDHRARHADLARLGLPLSKGLLFHGPPGTGKTYTCRWVVGELPDTTAFVVAGQSLHHVKSVCGLARLLAPSLVILEDVDLVFAEREKNFDTSALGDLMDEMDGFRPHEAVSFILTTNALDRVERAIKDRPGRIGQCVYFGPPDAELRRRYLVQYLAPFDASAVDPAALAADSRGSSQAFLKEWIARAALFALEEESRRETDPLRLTPADFAAALAELTRGGTEGAAVIGFGGGAGR